MTADEQRAEVRKLAVEWFKTGTAIADLEQRIHDGEKAVRALREANGITEGKLDRCAPPRTHVIEVAPGKCVVLAWDDDHETHAIDIADIDIVDDAKGAV